MTVDSPTTGHVGETKTIRRRSPLTPLEIATAAALADVAAVLCILSRFIPLGSAVSCSAAVPFAALSQRHRLRVAAAGLLTGGVVALLLGGQGAATTLLGFGALGCLVGTAIRLRWSNTRLAITAAVAVGAPVGLVVTVALAVLDSYRRLAFAQSVNSWQGTARVLRSAQLSSFADTGDAMLSFLLAQWWWCLLTGVVLAVAAGVVATRYVFALPLRVLAVLSPVTAQVRDDDQDAGDDPHPLPLSLHQVSVSYSGSSRPALAPFDLHLDRGELVAIIGPNGAGKSTLTRVIAGLPPTAGDVDRPGGVGRGLPGGTASIFQRPDSQVLGVRVGDDVVWGHQVADAFDVDELLSQVGLAGFADRETATLSGGELQRLAIASALGRHPALLISDESTAMLDKASRAGIMQLFRSLTDDGEKSVVHVTHHREEELAADRSIELSSAAPAHAAATRAIPLQAHHRIDGGSLSLCSVSFSHDAGSPWERAALRSISFEVCAGETILLTGANGAGKSTLAWLMAGLLQPTSGELLLDGEPVQNGRDGAVLGLQHSRQQLLRPTVIEEVRDAAGVDRIAAAAALEELGLAPDTYADRRVDELSGGEQRRVALAGLIACHPRALVLDEPLAGLDTAAKTAMSAALRRLRAAGLTLVIISHDTTELLAFTDAVYEMENGSVVGSPPGPQTPEAARHRRPSLSRVVGRALPGDSFARRLWVGTKMGVITALALMVGIRPTWITVGVAAAVLALWTGLGQVPRGALPRLPRWFIAVTPLAAVLAALGGKTPYVTIGGYRLSAGGVNQWALFTAIAALSLYASMLFTWTTPAADLPPFLEGISRLCRRLHIPAEATTATIAVGLRLGPLLLDECRTVYTVAAQRHRSQRVRPARRRRELLFNSLALVCALAIRRAGEMAEAMVARGGIGMVAQHISRPARRDLYTAVVSGIAVGLGLFS